ncbi:Alpha/Beta hydrolase protein [Paraphoma chrysanthemicola]|uniref:Alpha/Beta hydrolase protein n=1 Tax=Paraphoma chrysanthemicola TaxID=798071 RepID=A0A8K0R518_9PLEO|nr:Alpha/Beta hydrolase protein [Paraphoma chrysanthemicola]
MAQLGICSWYEADKAEVDIVFVHGLRGGRESTWTKDGVLWPRDLLAKDVPDSRIIGYGYDSRIVHAETKEVVQGSLEDDAQTLCSQLDELRRTTNTTERPIVTVGHSMGGLVLAQVVYGGDKVASGNSLRSISDKIVGMLFLGTPFHGSPTAPWGETIRRLWDIIGRDSDRNTLKSLAKDSQLLKPLRDGWPQVIQKRGQTKDAKIAVSYCFEKLKTGFVVIVPRDNAHFPGVGGEPIPMRTNHVDICKFNDPDEDQHYKIVKEEIKKLIAASAPEEGLKQGGNSYRIDNTGTIVNLNQGGTQTIPNQVNHFYSGKPGP